MGKYDTAQICLNGHLITKYAITFPENKKNHCSDCGQPTITDCSNCGESIRGGFVSDEIFWSDDKYIIPKYCEKCGLPFLWTKQIINSANELIEFSEYLNLFEKNDLKSSVLDIVNGGPKAIVAQEKYKKYVSKAGTVLSNGLRDILIDILSESIKKELWG